MNSTQSSPKLKSKASSDVGATGQSPSRDANAERAAEKTKAKESKKKKRAEPKERTLQFDLFGHLVYLSAIATSGITRTELFEQASKLPYSSSKYFRSVHMLAQKLNIDYAEACRMVAQKTKVEEVKSFFLRFAGAMSSGEDEADFLLREAEVRGESFGNSYERDIESLKKWTDAYVTLVVAAGLIVIVAVISMMIYEVGTAIVVGLAMTMVFVTCLGAWIIYISSPREIKTRVKGLTSSLQKRSRSLFTMMTPLAVTVAAVLWLLKLDLGYILMIVAALILPAGYLMSRDDKKVGKKDEDIPTVVRVIGAVTSAMGTTITVALEQIDRRSMGSLMPEITRLRYRLSAGINPRVCWARLVDETGSELVERTISMFWDAIDLGGEPGKVGNAASMFASKIAFLRASRSMVASTFKWLILPLHSAMVGLMLFIPEIIKLFTLKIAEAQASLSEGGSTNIPNSSISVDQLFSFGNVDLGLITALVTLVVLVLTAANAFAPKAAEGGHPIKTMYNLGILLFITGALMILVPLFAQSIFSSIVES